MNKHVPTACSLQIAKDTAVLRRVMVFSLLLLAIMAGGGWWMLDVKFAQSIILGGILVNGSFWLLQKDAQRLLHRVSEAEASVVVHAEKTRFFFRSFARLIVLGLVLFVVASQVPIDVVGLTLGFATVMVSVVIIGLGTGKCWLPSKV